MQLFLYSVLLLLSHLTYAQVIPITQATFESVVLKAPKPVIIDFNATWCKPCKEYKPVFEELSQKYGNKYIFGSVDIDESPEIADKYNVTKLPSFAIINNSVLYQLIIGPIAADVFEQTIEKALASAPTTIKLTQTELDQKLLLAIGKNNQHLVTNVIEQGANPNAIFTLPIGAGPHMGKSQEVTPLYIATIIQFPAMVEVLLQAGASPDTIIKGPDGKERTVEQAIKQTYKETKAAFNKAIGLIEHHAKKRSAKSSIPHP